MGFLIKLSNLVKKVFETDELSTVEGSAEVFNDEWTSYVNGELKQSNETNAKSLGGRPRSCMDEEDESNHFEVNMEKIMSRFNTFNSLMSNSSANEEDDEEEKPEEEPEGEDQGEPLT